MKIKADQEGFTTIQRLCDGALKAAGLANMPAVITLLQSIELIPEGGTDAGKEKGLHPKKAEEKEQVEKPVL